MKMTENFGDNLKILRKLYGYTQDELAKSINASRSCISNYESGSRQPDSKTLTLIADIFDVSVDFLLGRSPVKSVMRDENILTLLYDSVEKVKNTVTLDISKSPAKIKCAIMEFYAYLIAKEDFKKKSRYAVK